MAVVKWILEEEAITNHTLVVAETWTPRVMHISLVRMVAIWMVAEVAIITSQGLTIKISTSSSQYLIITLYKTWEMAMLHSTSKTIYRTRWTNWLEILSLSSHNPNRYSLSSNSSLSKSNLYNSLCLAKLSTKLQHHSRRLPNLFKTITNSDQKTINSKVTNSNSTILELIKTIRQIFVNSMKLKEIAHTSTDAPSHMEKRS